MNILSKCGSIKTNNISRLTSTIQLAYHSKKNGYIVSLFDQSLTLADRMTPNNTNR
jgi:hypothetical protein